MKKHCAKSYAPSSQKNMPIHFLLFTIIPKITQHQQQPHKKIQSFDESKTKK